jgi:antitoxin VapB
MRTTSICTTKQTQIVSLPDEVRLPDDVKYVTVRAVGDERIIAPINSSWDSFFLSPLKASEDFVAHRASQAEVARESFDVDASSTKGLK